MRVDIFFFVVSSELREDPKIRKMKSSLLPKKAWLPIIRIDIFSSGTSIMGKVH